MPTPNLTTAQLLNIEPLEYPIPRDQTAIVYRERYWINTANYSPVAIGTVHPSKSGYYLVTDQPYRATEYHTFFERTYATVPAARDEPLSYSYTFPGYFNAGTDTVIRYPVTWTVLARVAHYYELNADPTHASTGITQIARQRYYVTSDGSEQGYVATTTTPTLSTYEGYVSGETELVAEDSSLEPYMGNIWVRKTPYVIAR